MVCWTNGIPTRITGREQWKLFFRGYAIGDTVYDWLKSHFFMIPLHPLMWVTMGTVAGIAGYYGNVWWLVPLAVVASCMLCAVGSGFFNVRLTVIAPLLYLVLGIFLGWWRAHGQQLSHTQSSAALVGTVDLVGTVVDRAPAQHRVMRECISLSHLSFRPSDGHIFCPITGAINLYVAHLPDCHIGDTIAVDGIKLKSPTDNGFGRYLMRNGVLATCFTPRLPNVRLVSRPSWSVWRAVWNKREQMLKEAQRNMSSDTFALYASLFLGNRAVCRKELEQMTPHFQQWGIMHYLARSGLHLVIFAAAWTFLFRFIPMPLLLRQLCLLGLAFVYALFSWLSLSFIRAFAVFVLYHLCGIFRLPFHFLYCLTLVCFCVLIWNPVQLLFLDFQLSFALTFALGWFGLLRRAEQHR